MFLIHSEWAAQVCFGAFNGCAEQPRVRNLGAPSRVARGRGRLASPVRPARPIDWPARRPRPRGLLIFQPAGRRRRIRATQNGQKPKRTSVRSAPVGSGVLLALIASL